MLRGATWRVANLETSVTRSDDWAPGKGVHYRMNPDNVDVLRVAGVDVWSLANNHVLDFGLTGLEETVDVLTAAGQRLAGAGRDAAEAWRPADVGADGRRLVVWSVAHRSSGVRSSWAATATRPGVALLPALDDAAADELADRVREHRRPGDLVVVSVHWGGNWGYPVPPDQRRFAHRLVDAGVHVVHGHSSHHPRSPEVYRGGVVLYGCGDLVNDYEGIGGHERFRDDLRLVYVVRFAPGDTLREMLHGPVPGAPDAPGAGRPARRALAGEDPGRPGLGVGQPGGGRCGRHAAAHRPLRAGPSPHPPRCPPH